MIVTLMASFMIGFLRNIKYGETMDVMCCRESKRIVQSL